MTDNPNRDNPLKGAIYTLLEKFPFGLSEFELIQELSRTTELISDDFAKDTLLLFQTHFMVYNALYQLQLELSSEGKQYLDVGPLNISLHLAAGGSNKTVLVNNSDAKLKSYYLDMNHLTNTSEEDVNSMLRRFWEKYYAAEDRHEALKTLGMTDPVDYAGIKKQYRLLAGKFHPDRGGDKEKLQEINEAMDVLKRYYGPWNE